MAHIESFEEFVKYKSRQKGDLSEDKRIFWTKSIEILYSRIKNYWLKPYKEIKIVETEMEMSEPFLGTYKLKSLMLSLGKERVMVKPISSTSIGGYGRVDIIGKNQTINLLLSNNGKWEYKIKTPFVEIRELNKHTFLDITRTLMND
jgi:hypothetical protein